MTAVDISSRAASTFIGIESSFGSVPTMTRCFPDTGSTLEIAQDNVQNPDERVRIKTALATIQGNKSCSAKLTAGLRVDGTQLLAAGSASTPWLGILLKALLGGEAAAAGSTIASAASGTSITVGAGHGARFKIGTWVAVDVAGTLEAARVINVSTDTLTLRPALSGTPSASAIVVNSYTYFPTETNTQTLYLQHAKAQDATAHKWSLGGLIGSLAISLPPGERATVEATLKGKTWSFPSDDTIAVTSAADTMAAPMVVRNAVTLIQAPATTTKTHYPMHGLEIGYPGDSGMVHVPELGGVEGATGAMRVGERPWGTVKLKLRADTQLHTWYAAQTTLSVVCMIPYGSGTSKRFLVLDLPCCQITAVPKPADEGGRLVQEVELQLMEDTTTTTSGLTGTNLDCALAPMRLALI
jgi:hypothetical protein